MLHEKYAELDRVEDLLPLSLKIARLKIVGRAQKERSAAARITQVPVDDLPLAASGADPFEQAARTRTCGSAGSGAG